MTDVPTSPTAQKIMDVAERRTRAAGYDAVSFRDIAAEVGVKSASVHYHFPTKDGLTTAVARRYTDRFMDALAATDGQEPQQQLTTMTGLFRRSLVEEDLMCLCGILGAEIGRLALETRAEVARFFDLVSAWLAEVLNRAGAPQPQDAAEACLATLEGAMIMARTKGDIGLFDRIAARPWLRLP